MRPSPTTPTVSNPDCVDKARTAWERLDATHRRALRQEELATRTKDMVYVLPYFLFLPLEFCFDNNYLTTLRKERVCRQIVRLLPTNAVVVVGFFAVTPSDRFRIQKLVTMGLDATENHDNFFLGWRHNRFQILCFFESLGHKVHVSN